MPRKKIVFILLILAAGAAMGFRFFEQNQNTEAGNVLIYGNVDIREVQLAFYATGRITRLLVDEGDRVEKGQLIAELDPSRYRHSLTKLEGEMAAQKELVARLEKGSRPQEKEQARASVEAAEAQLVLAGITLKRMKELSRTKFVPQQQLDDAQAEFRAASARLKAAKEELSLVLEGPRTEDIQRAKSQLKALESAIALAGEQLIDTKLYSPAAGIIQNRILEPGAMAFPSAPVFSLALTEPLWIRAYIPEPQLGKVSRGMKIEVSTDSFPGKVYKGWVGFISPVAEFTPKAVQTEELRTKLVYRARCFVCNSNGELRLGMPVTVRVLIDSPPVESAETFCSTS